MNSVGRTARYLLASFWLLAGIAAAMQCGLIAGDVYAASPQVLADAPSNDGQSEHCEAHCPAGGIITSASRDHSDAGADFAPAEPCLVQASACPDKAVVQQRPWPDIASRLPQVLAHLATDRLLI